MLKSQHLVPQNVPIYEDEVFIIMVKMRLNLVQSDWCSYKKRLGHTERDLGDAARRWPPAGQEERPQRKPAPPGLQLELPASRTERREFLLFEPRCWCFVMSMLANSYNI